MRQLEIAPEVVEIIGVVSVGVVATALHIVKRI